MNNDWQKIQLITSAEHHFNDLCFKIRILASTWLLACMGGVGFLLSKTINVDLQTNQLLILLCWVGAIGTMVLWVLDLLIYQKLLNAWFSSREKIEHRNTDFPQIFREIKATQPGGRASNLIRVFYIALVSLPLFISMYIAIYMHEHLGWAIASATLWAAMLTCLLLKSTQEHSGELCE